MEEPFNSNGPLTVEHSEFCENSATEFGGAIYNNGGYLTEKYNEFEDNFERSGGDIYNTETLTSLLNNNKNNATLNSQTTTRNNTGTKNNPNNNQNNTNTIPMQKTGTPLTELILGMLAVLGGTLIPRKKH